MYNLESEFVPYNQAKALKEIGFDVPCLSYYEGESFSNHLAIVEHEGKDDYIVPAPLHQQVFGWLWEKHNLMISFKHYMASVKSKRPYWYDIMIVSADMTKRKYDRYRLKRNIHYNTYEEARIACIDRCIEVIKHGIEL